MAKDDLQSLLPASVQNEVAAVSIRSLRLGILAATAFCIGSGLLLGKRLAAFTFVEWIALLLIALSLIVGAAAGRSDAAILDRFTSQDDDA